MPGFWTSERDGMLFLFALHGFGELARYCTGPAREDADAFWSDVVADWLGRCGRPRLPAWHPYPTSGRIVAWLAALSRGGWDAGLRARMTGSLWRQLRFLARSVERDIGGNHVLRNACALAIGGACLGAPAMHERGLRLLRSELASQLLADGGHEERSPSYQREIVGDVRDVRTVRARAGASALPWLDEAISRMEAWLRALAGPDGALPLLNDAWEGPPVERASTAPLRDLKATGYVVLRSGGDQAVLDVGPVAPDHLPAHAHADVLSFVLWADGRPLVVDPGSFEYSGPDRDAFRATAAHNTVEVDGADQCDFWGAFRAAALPRVRRLLTDADRDATVVVAEHDGYRRLREPVVHRRAFCWLPSNGIVVLDRLLGSRAHDVRSSLHLAPGLSTGASGDLAPFRVAPVGAAPRMRAESGRYAPYLGRERPTTVLRQVGTVASGDLFGWSILRRPVTVEADRGAVRLTLDGGRALEVSL